MLIQVIRPIPTNSPTTISKMFIDGVYFCDVLEDQDRDLWAHKPGEIAKKKIKHQTAIPYGKYEVVLSFSERFQVFLPLLLNVPGFIGIRIHAGNTKEDTSGCLLLGTAKGNTVQQSKMTVSKLKQLITSYGKKQKIYIEILPSQFDFSQIRQQ